MNIIIAGDFFISEKYKNINIDQEVIDLFTSADFRILNLEAPLTTADKNNKINKVGPHLKANPTTVLPILRKLNIDLVTLANNHIMDYGVKGLNDTISSCMQNKIGYIGAGANRTESQKTHFIQNESIAIINIAENEWASSTNSYPGANPMNIVDNVKQIKLAKERTDKVIVIIHGGNEYYNFPSPRIQEQYRLYVDSGASAIIAHHTHCISGYEIYNNAPIFYGLGNFLFTISSLQENWYTGLVLKLEILSNKIEFKIYQIFQDKKSFNIQLSKDFIQNNIEKYNNIICNKVLLEKEWNLFLEKKQREYLQSLSILNYIPSRYIRAFLSRLLPNNILLPTRHLKNILSLIQCEAHYDATKDILLNYLKDK